MLSSLQCVAFIIDKINNRRVFLIMHACAYIIHVEQHQQVSSQLEAGKNDVRNIQQALNTAEQELEQCQDSQEECNRRASTTSAQL